MDDKKITALLTAVKTGSLSKAAQELGYTQSGLTQMMNGLEDELGCALLVRGYNGVRLTEIGQELLPLFEDAAFSLRRLREEALNYKAGSSYPIRIGVFPSLSKQWLPQVLKQYQNMPGSAPIELSVGGDDIPRLLEEGLIDLALVEEGMKGSGTWFHLMDDNYFAAVHVDNPLSKKDTVTITELTEHPFIMSSISELRAQLKPYTSGKLRNEIQVNCVDDAAIMSLVEQGLGVSILPELALTNCPETVKILKISPSLKRVLGISIIRSPRRQVADFAKFLMGFAQEK